MFTIAQVSRMISVTPNTIRNWAIAKLIPQPFRLGRQRRWMWSKTGVGQILRYAESEGYRIPQIHKKEFENEQKN